MAEWEHRQTGYQNYKQHFWKERRHLSSGLTGRWRLCAESMSSRGSATCRSTSSSSGLSTACCTTNSSWRGCASTIHPLTMTSGTVEVLAGLFILLRTQFSFVMPVVTQPPPPPPAALADISEMVLQLQGTMMKMENFQKLLELKKDLTGIDNLVMPGRVRFLKTFVKLMTHPGVLGRQTISLCSHVLFLFDLQEFIRLGCLSKLSGKGLQQRMFFLVRRCNF